MSNQDTITILFADVCRSTQLFEQHGDVKAREIIASCLSAMSQVTKKYGGKVIKTIGDEVMCELPTANDGVMAACDMQRRASSDLTLARYKIEMRVGLHFGNVVREDDDVFGDAVNVASRMAGLAKAQQIVTTQSTVKDVDPQANIEVRSLGKTRVKGKLMPIEIVDVLWQEDTSNVTMVSAAIKIDEEPTRAQIKLRYGDRSIEVKDTSPPFTMGRDRQNDLIVDDEWVSRNHASIEFRKGYFILVDRSTNGTYLKIDGDDEIRVHRDEVHLRKSGVISLGQLSSNRQEQHLLYFECVAS